MRRKIIGALVTCIALAIFASYTAEAEKMHVIKVDLGNNIEITAKESGAPRFGVENHWGLKIYELVNLRPDVVVRFSRPGFEIDATPLFALTMFADSENKNDMAVENIILQYDYSASSHQTGKAFVEDIVKQFNRGKWRRHIRDNCPATSGRSAYLDENGIIRGTCPLDPAYVPPIEDWLQLMRLGKEYEWLGSGVLAKLSVQYDEDTRGLTYSINLEFQDFAIDNRRNDAAQARELIEGDQKGWNSTKNYKDGIAKRQAVVKLMEENAVKRGDHLVPRD